MGIRLIPVSTPIEKLRTIYFDLRASSDGVTPVTIAAGTQPQISINKAGFSDTGIGTLEHLGNGRYGAVLDVSVIGVVGDSIESRAKHATSVDSPGDSVQIVDDSYYNMFGGSSVRGWESSDITTLGRTIKETHVSNDGLNVETED
jgi:hypothetical protein